MGTYLPEIITIYIIVVKLQGEAGITSVQGGEGEVEFCLPSDVLYVRTDSVLCSLFLPPEILKSKKSTKLPEKQKPNKNPA